MRSMAQCNHCKTKYRIDIKKISDSGSRLRCQKCFKLFVIKKSDVLTSDVEPTPEITLLSETRVPDETTSHPAAPDIRTDLNPSGRIDFKTLETCAMQNDVGAFVRLIQAPSLAGSMAFYRYIKKGSESGYETAWDLELTTITSQFQKQSDRSLVLDTGIFPLTPKQAILPSQLIIGRIDTCDIVMSDHTISRKHAEIIIDQDGYFLRDFGSTNGSAINDEDLEEQPVRLHPGHLIRIGRYFFTFLPPEALYAQVRMAIFIRNEM